MTTYIFFSIIFYIWKNIYVVQLYICVIFSKLWFQFLQITLLLIYSLVNLSFLYSKKYVNLILTLKAFKSADLPSRSLHVLSASSLSMKTMPSKVFLSQSVCWWVYICYLALITLDVIFFLICYLCASPKLHEWRHRLITYVLYLVQCLDLSGHFINK